MKNNINIAADLGSALYSEHSQNIIRGVWHSQYYISEISRLLPQLAKPNSISILIYYRDTNLSLL